jgi:hypothetical protein
MLLAVSLIGGIMLSFKFLLDFLNTVFANHSEFLRLCVFFSWIAVVLGIGTGATYLVASLPISVGDGP